MARDILNSSFRDPSGYMFRENGTLYRQVNKTYGKTFDQFIASGLYDRLVSEKLLVPHQDVSHHIQPHDKGYKVIQPEEIPFISYPYEWSFSQFKDAALATLKIQEIALAHDMILKDASAYNVQFYKGRPMFIDTLSFDFYQEGEPWAGYRQYCQHFLAPLFLMSFTDVRLSQLLRAYIDGLPLDLTSKLLPAKTKLRPQLAMHIHLHAKSQQKYADKQAQKRQVSRRALEGLMASLISTTKSLKWQPLDTEWGEYYTFTNYSDDAFEHKKQLVDEFTQQIKPVTIWDLGANTGVFSRVGAQTADHTVAFDIDPVAVETNYRETRKQAEENILPLVMDLTNLSPAIGWAHKERAALMERGPVDLVLALALIHHIAISNNVPLAKVAKFVSDSGQYLIIEFVPKTDSQVQKLLATREDIFSDYTKRGFEAAFGNYFEIIDSQPIKKSKRRLYLMKKRGS